MISIKYQCLGTLSLPTTLYVFHRIKKLKLGILLHCLSSVLMGASFFNIILLLKTGNFGLYLVISVIILGYGLYLPMLYVSKWTRTWNHNLLNQEKPNNS